MFDGARVKLLRNQMNISANTLAKAVGVSHSYISLVEIGHRIPTRDTQARIAKFFGCGIEALQIKRDEGDEKNVFHIEDSDMKAKQFNQVDRNSHVNEKLVGDLDNFNVEIIFQLVKEVLNQVANSAKALEENPPSFSIAGKIEHASIHGDYHIICTKEQVILQVNAGEDGLALFKGIHNNCSLPDVILLPLSHENETIEFVWFTEYASHFQKSYSVKGVSSSRELLK
jgi:transcriptional regulator with XRE-family HTH domain